MTGGTEQLFQQGSGGCSGMDCHVHYGHCWLQPCTGQGHPLPKPWHSGSDVRSPAVRAGLMEGEGIVIHQLKCNHYWAINIWMQGHYMVLSDKPVLVHCWQSSSKNTHFYISILSQKWVSLTPRNLIIPLNSIQAALC